MPGSKSAYLEQKVLDHVLGQNGGAFTMPSIVYIALYTSILTDSATGTNAAAGEVPVTVSSQASGYARYVVNNNSTNWTAATGTSPSSKSNATPFSFNTATQPWGTVQSFAILDVAAVQTGNILYWATLTAPKTIGTGDTASFAAGQITLTEN